MWMQFISSLFAAVCLLVAAVLLNAPGPALLLALSAFAAWYSHDESNSWKEKNAATIIALFFGAVAFLRLAYLYYHFLY